MFSIFFKPKQKGFTLIEMIVVIAIFLITTVIVLSNFKGFNRKSQLDLLAREMSLVIRQAQVYGTATRLSTGTGFSSYGIHVAFPTSSSKPTNFVLYASGNSAPWRYDANKKVEQFNLTGGIYIDSIVGEGDCSGCTLANGLNIVFPRPNPGAIFANSNILGPEQHYSDVIITIKDPGIEDSTPDHSLSTRRIFIWNTGHIYVESELGN